jgi:acetyltransferase
VAAAASSYPAHLVEQRQLEDGTTLSMRPIRADDLAMHARFASELSPATHYARFLSPRKLGEDELKRMTDIDYAVELALVATIRSDGLEHEIGVARYVKTDASTAAVAVVVADRWQRRGVAERLMRKLIVAAADRGVACFDDITLHDNRPMLTLARKLGFIARRHPLDPYLIGLTLRITH